MAARMRYRGHVYQVDNGNWRGPDGHTVHLLTWVTDDLKRREDPLGEPPAGGPSDLDTARQVAARLGEEAQVLDEPAGF